MKITSLTLWTVPLTSHETYYMAEGKTCDVVDTVVLRIQTDSGIEGWGEVCPIPHYLPAFSGGVIPVIEELAPMLLGANPVGAEALMTQVNHYLKGHVYAKSALDIALWDITAKAANLPLYVLLGGKHSATLPLYHSVTCIDPDDMARIAHTAYQSGIRQFQAKLGADNDWQADVARLRKMREAVGEGPLVYGDWNCGATKLDAIRVGRAVADLDIMLEQPCETIDECASVKSTCGLPMKLDEVAHDIDAMLQAHKLDCLDVMALKLSKFGGITPCRKARDMALHMGTKLCIECTWGSDIVTSAALHLAAATPLRLIQNVCDLSSYVFPRIDPEAPTRNDGTITVSDKPGLGVTPDAAVLGEPVAYFQ